uniref:Uncharacterized protein n=1 Tax=Solanum tuberosum TaxID=4113 RepID=M1AUZ1_SOLTU
MDFTILPYELAFGVKLSPSVITIRARSIPVLPIHASVGSGRGEDVRVPHWL